MFMASPVAMTRICEKLALQVEKGGGRFALEIPPHKPIQQIQLLAFFGHKV